MLSEKQEEILESIWSVGDRQNNTLDAIRKRSSVDFTDADLDELERRELIIRDHDKISLANKGKSIAEERQLLQVNRNDLDKLKFVNMLKQVPNIKGEWFNVQSPRCSSCGKEFKEIKGLNVGFLKFKCPYCGHQNG